MRPYEARNENNSLFRFFTIEYEESAVLHAYAL
jgi:hypothetical protein